MKNLFILFLISVLTIWGYFIAITHSKEVIVSFSVDDNYATFLPVTIESIKAHSNPNRAYKIFILGNKISEDHAKSIYSTQSKNIKIKIIDIQDLVLKKI